MHRGEVVNRTRQAGIQKLDKTWTLRTIVYWTGDRYNVAVYLQEDAGMLSNGDRYSLMENGGKTKQSVKETADNIIQQLFQQAADDREARTFDLSITVE